MSDPYEVRISREASSHLEEIFGYIERQSPQTAALVIDRLLAGIASLDQFPRRFKLAPRQARAKHPVHSMVVRPFIVNYRVIEEGRIVQILAVRRGARRPPRRFDD